jgi:predicted nuclease of predicted toxin-antitoxin system
MRFLVDECTGPAVAAWLNQQGHDVFSVYDQWPGASAGDLLDLAYRDDWMLITNDRDFGELIFREGRPHRGVIFLRLDDERAANKIRVLGQLLSNYASQLPNQFVVVTQTHVRFAGTHGAP